MIAPIQIKRPDVTQEVRELAALTGVSITDAIKRAVRTQLVIERAGRASKLSKRQMQAERALTEIRNMPVVGKALTDADLYDAEGLPK